MEVILKIRNLESFLKSIAAAEDYFNNTDGTFYRIPEYYAYSFVNFLRKDLGLAEGIKSLDTNAGQKRVFIIKSYLASIKDAVEEALYSYINNYYL